MNDTELLLFVSRTGTLVYKFLVQDITDDEMTELYHWVFARAVNQQLIEEFSDPATVGEMLNAFLSFDVQAAWREVQERLSIGEDKG